MAEASLAVDQEAAAGSAPSIRRFAAETFAMSLTVALPLLFFWRLLTPRLADRAHVAWGDFAAQYYPLRLFVSRELAQGRLPLWNPYINGGQPALADSQSAVFYPPNMALALLAPGGELSLDWLEWYVVGHFVLAGIFTYLFARYALRAYGGKVARLSALVVSGTFTFGGYLTSFPVQQLSILEAAVWLPLLILLLDLARDRRSLALYAAASLPLALSWLAGHGQTTMYLVYAAGAYEVARILLAWRARSDCWLVVGTAFTMLAGTSLAAIQLLPTYEFLGLSNRVDLSYADTHLGLPLAELVGLVWPKVLGGPTLYVGIASLGLALVSLLADGRQALVRISLGLSLVSLLVAFGGNTFLYSFLYIVVPGFSSVRDQERAVYIFSFFVSMLAGNGLAIVLTSGRAAILASLRKVRRLLLIAGLASAGTVMAMSLFVSRSPESSNAINQASFAMVILLCAAGLFRLWETKAIATRSVAVMFLGLIVLDLFTSSWDGNLMPAKDYVGYSPNKVTQALTNAGGVAGAWRVSSEGLLPGGGSAASVFQMRDIVANTPFQLRTYAQAISHVDEVQRSRLLSVGYWLTKRRLSDGRFREVAAEGDLRLYELRPELRLPRAYVAHATVWMREDAALAKLSTVDLAGVALLTNPDGTAASTRVAATALDGQRMGPDEQVLLVADRPSYQEVSAKLAAPGVLILSESFYPGWRAIVDGRETPVWRAQYLLRGVELDSGLHRVEFIFEPASLQIGSRVSLGSAALLIAIVLVSWGIARRRRVPSVPLPHES